MMKLPWKPSIPLLLSLRFLGLGRRGESSNARKSLYGAVAGIGLSLIPLIIVLVVANGMIEGISSRLVELSSSHLKAQDMEWFVDTETTAASLSLIAQDLRDSKDDLGIEGAWGERQGIGIAIGKKGRGGATIRGIEGRYFEENKAARELISVSAGDLSLSGKNDALIGKKLASDIGLEVGDTLRIMTLRPNGKVPQFSTFKVRGIISSGYQELDALWVFIPLEAGFKALATESSRTYINIRTPSPFGDIETIRSAVSRSLPDRFTVNTWREYNQAQFQSFNTTRILLLFIMFLILIVATVNISSALIMLVMERRREIAILKSTGASPSTITYAFLFAGFLTGLGGLCLGLPLGLFCAIHINGLFSLLEKGINGAYTLGLYVLRGKESALGASHVYVLDPAFYLEKIPVHLYFLDIFYIAAGTLVLSVLVSLLPSMRAGREKPIDILRKL